MTPPTRPVLVVVDVQNGFVRDASRHVVPVIADLVDRWQSAGLDVVFTRYFNAPGSKFERLFGWTGLQGPPETDLVPELTAHARRATAIVDKHTYSLFTPHGHDLVRRHTWTDLYVCGIATESCVLKTAADAFEQGDLTPWIIEDASATTPALPHTAPASWSPPASSVPARSSASRISPRTSSLPSAPPDRRARRWAAT